MAFQAGAIVSKLTLDKSKFSASVKSVQKETKTLGKWVKRNAGQFKAMGFAIAAIGAAALLTFKKMVKQYVEVGDMVHKMALRTGFAAETLSELAYAADISGADITMLEKGVKKMAKTITDASYGLETYLRVFRGLGLEVDELLEMSPEEQFFKIGNAIAEMESDTLRTAAAVDVFGRSGTMLLPLFKEGAAGIEKLREEARRLGIVFDMEAAVKAAKLKDAQTALKGSLQGLSFAIVSEIIPVLTELTKEFTDGFVEIRSGAKDVTKSLLTSFKTIVHGIEGLVLAFDAFQAFVFKFGEAGAKFFRTYIENLIMGFGVLASMGAPVKGVLKKLVEAWTNLRTIEKGYFVESEKYINKMANTIEGFEKLYAAIDKVLGELGGAKKAIKETAAATDELGKSEKIFTHWSTTIAKIAHDVSARWAEMRGEFIAEAIIPSAAFNIPKMSLKDFGDFCEQWLSDLKEKWQSEWQELLYWAGYFISGMSSLFNQLSMNQMQSIQNEYEARKAAIESSMMGESAKAKAIERLEVQTAKKRRAAELSAAKTTKAVTFFEALVHTASAVAEALPNIPLSILVGALGAAQAAAIMAQPLPIYARGGDIGTKGGVVGEGGPELFFPDRPGTIVPLRDARLGRGGISLTVAPVFYINTMDEIGVREFIRERGLSEIVEAVKLGILKPEFKKALGV